MDQQVFEIEEVRGVCLSLLRKHGRSLTAGEICVDLRLPLWAVQAGLDSAHLAGLATFTGGVGWSLAEPEARRQEKDAAQGDLL